MRTNGKRILIVEDDQALAIALRDAFKAEGAVVLGPAPTVFYARHLLGRRGIDCAVVSADLHAGESDVFSAQLTSSGTPVLTLGQGEGETAAIAGALMRPVAAPQVVDSVIALLNARASDDRLIEVSSPKAVKALGLDDNPHMRVVRVRTELMRRLAVEQKPEPL